MQAIKFNVAGVWGAHGDLLTELAHGFGSAGVHEVEEGTLDFDAG